jgi:hypothetical protein
LLMATCYRFASNTRLSGVLVAIRKREKPLLVSTSSNAAGPAWAPSDSPPSWSRPRGRRRPWRLEWQNLLERQTRPRLHEELGKLGD